jgi:hypothetical protein
MVPQAGRYMLGLVKLSSYHLEPLLSSSRVTTNLSISIAPLTAYPYDNYAYGSTFVISVRLRSGIPGHDHISTSAAQDPSSNLVFTSPTNASEPSTYLVTFAFKIGRASVGCCWDKNPIFCECH